MAAEIGPKLAVAVNSSFVDLSMEMGHMLSATKPGGIKPSTSASIFDAVREKHSKQVDRGY